MFIDILKFIIHIIKYANVWCLLAIIDSIFVIMSTKENHIVNRAVKTAVYRTGGLIIFASIADMIGYYFYGLSDFRYLVFLVYTVIYTVPMLVPIVYSDSVESGFLKTRHGHIVLLIVFMYVVSMFINLFIPVYFTIDEGCKYVQGQFWYLRSMIMALIYFAAFAEIIRKKYILSMGEIKTVNHVIILFIVGVIYTDIFYSGQIIEMIMAAGFSFITSMFNNLEMKTDPVTGLANRVLYTKDAFKYENAGSLVVVSIDVNDLKKINDRLGHAVGDAYLRASALTYNKYLRKYGKIYRIGGDEFVFLGENHDAVKEVMEKLDGMKKTDEEFGNFDLSAAYGILVKKSDESVFDAVNKADILMYRCKRRMKKDTIGKQ
ncbi:GGDEF domain-containing protein [Oribacterium sp. WCC10]|uniref:GGDEF domain-containing protein n=1 Tax=Oribacterium sp. WCC10 TaxID=1855343 RepID=UPI0008E30D6D|nr:GGDEF domain-containing protein [Oribacterium sp. WCC10]SFG19778.1 diguanylate cyclase (GGDEF) domain-containing protein [Oribacterium sp. WCC10]